MLFRLTADNGPDRRCARAAGEQQLQCWRLTVVNRGEELSLWFLEGTGPVYAENQGWARDDARFVRPVGADGSAEFLVHTSGYEFAGYQWGRVRFTKAQDGRWVIQLHEIRPGLSACQPSDFRAGRDR